MKKYTWTKKLLVAMLATGMVVTSMPDTGLNVSKVFAAKVSTKQHTITEDGFYYNEEGFLYKYTGEETDVVIPEGVTQIGSTVFDDKITSVVIPGTVKELGSFSFADCTNLKKVVMKDGVEVISSYAFKGCTALTDVTIPNTVTTIEYDAFSEATALTSIALPKSLTAIGSHAFEKSGLTSITIPGSVETLEYGTFRECTSLQSVLLEDGVKSVGSNAFSRDTALTSVTFPSSGLERIEEQAFFQCEKIENLTIENCEVIESMAFCFPNALKKLHIGSGVKGIEENAFCFCYELEELTIDPGLEKIGDDAFRYARKLTNVELPNTITYIGTGAFYGSKQLSEVLLPTGLKYMGCRAFCESPWLENLYNEAKAAGQFYVKEGTVLLTTVAEDKRAADTGELTIPNKDSGDITVISDIWSDASKLNIGDGVISVGGCALMTMNNMEELTFADSVKTIGRSVCLDCDKLKKVTLPTYLQEIPEWMFGQCKNLTEVNIPNSVVKIGIFAFSECDSLEHISLPEDLTTIDMSAFKKMPALKELTIPAKVDFIGYNAFGTDKTYETDYNSITLKGYEGSLTQTYAEENDIPFISLGSMPSELEDEKNTQAPEATEEVTEEPEETDKPIKTPKATLEVTEEPKDEETTEEPEATEEPEETQIPEETEIPDDWDDEEATLEPEEMEKPTKTPKATEEPEGDYEEPEVTEEPEETAEPEEDGDVEEYSLKKKSVTTPKKVTKQEVSTVTVAPVTTEAPSYKVSLETDGGSCEVSSITVKNGTEYAKLPAVSKVNCVFKGWFTEPEGGMKVENTTVVNLASDQILYAQFIENSLNLSFEGNGGSLGNASSSKIVYAQDTYGELPQPTRSGYSFIGWYTEKSSGQIITEDMVVNSTGEMKLYAHWINTKQNISFDSLHYNFLNSRSAYGYSNPYRIPLSVFQYLYGKNGKAKNMYQEWPDWGGSCFGMTATALMLDIDGDGVELNDFGKNAAKNSDLSCKDVSTKSRISLTRFIETLQIAQRENEISQDKSNNKDNLDAMETAIKASQDGTGLPVILSIHSQTSGHAVAAYKIDNSKIYIYDPNYEKEEQYISITRDSSGKINGWSYKINGTEECGNNVTDSWISYYTYENIIRVWEKRSSECYSSEILVGCDVDSYTIYSESGSALAQMKNGQLYTKRSDIYLCDSDEDTSKDDSYKVYLPEGAYKIENTSGTGTFSVSVMGTERSITTTTESKQVTIDLQDFAGENECSITPSNGKNYSVTLESSALIDKESIAVSGVGNGSSIGVEQNQGAPAFVNCDSATVKVEDKSVSLVPVNASAGVGGTITRKGQKSVIKGEDAVYSITPEFGYMVSDVVVDGKSVGNVTSYTFTNISKSHSISATFEKVSFEKISVTAKTDIQAGVIPKLEVKLGNQVLTEKDDFKISKVSEDATTMKLLVTGLGNYVGTSNTVEFKIGDKAGTTKGEEEKKEETKEETVGSTHKVGNYKYKVTSKSAKTVTLTKKVTKKKAVTVPATVKINGTSYKVTAIGANVWKSDKTLESIVIGKNVKKIGAQAFYGAKKLKKITIKTKSLTSVGAGAFKGVTKKITVKVPAGKKKTYKKLLKKKGLPTKAKWK